MKVESEKPLNPNESADPYIFWLYPLVIVLSIVLSIALLFVLLYLRTHWSMLAFGILVGLIPTAGLGWLLFKRCKFTTAQLFCAVLMTGIELLVLVGRQPVSELSNKDISLMICAPIVSFLGLFLGSRMAGEPTGQSRVRFWGLFLFGLTVLIWFPAVIALLFAVTLRLLR